ncbi:unnamed protein product [Miscanthus lutarioriparius]|uniref:Uncharacterized protein n=1 Tax=Miscanthus lutarioriparius TaxID=422564 RepID=A0A811SAB9_9POAL|nr:unnamed protein product [Miscanthus lutarioriparius]
MEVPATIRFALDGEMTPYLLVKDLILQCVWHHELYYVKVLSTSFVLLEIVFSHMCEPLASGTHHRPTSLHDRGRDSDDDDFRDRDYDVAALANNLSQAFRYGIYNNDDIEEAQGSHERDDEDSSSLFTNSNWFTFDGDRGINDRLAASVPSSSPNSEEISLNAEETDEVLTGETTGTESLLESASLENGPVEEAMELVEVANDSDATTVSEKILCTKEDSASHESETSERPVDAQEGQTGGAAEASSIEGAANEPCSSLKTCVTLC